MYGHMVSWEACVLWVYICVYRHVEIRIDRILHVQRIQLAGLVLWIGAHKLQF
jgi:hypothetical protein